MTVPIFLVAVLTALLVAAAFFDLASYTIPNVLPGAMVVLFLVLMLALALDGHPMSWSEAGGHALAGFLALAAGVGCFAAGWIGGGDAKLFAAAALWLGWDAMYEYTIMASLLGGSLTVFLLWFRRIPLPSILTDQPWLARLANPKSGVPYGVALAMAAVVVLPGTELFRLAAVG